MLYALILLGLIPAVLLPDYLAKEDGPEDDCKEDMKTEPNAPDLLHGDLSVPDAKLEPLLEDEVATGSVESGTGVLVPLMEIDQSSGAILLPSIEDDLPSDIGTQIEGETLAPVIEIDEQTDWIEPDPVDILDPLFEDDTVSTLHPKIEDDPTLDVHEIAYNGSPAVVTGFDVSDDILKVTMSHEFSGKPLEVKIRNAEDPSDMFVDVDGEPVAIVEKAMNLSGEQIFVFVETGPSA